MTLPLNNLAGPERGGDSPARGHPVWQRSASALPPYLTTPRFRSARTSAGVYPA